MLSQTLIKIRVTPALNELDQALKMVHKRYRREAYINVSCIM